MEVFLSSAMIFAKYCDFS